MTELHEVYETAPPTGHFGIAMTMANRWSHAVQGYVPAVGDSLLRQVPCRSLAEELNMKFICLDQSCVPLGATSRAEAEYIRAPTTTLGARKDVDRS